MQAPLLHRAAMLAITGLIGMATVPAPAATDTTPTLLARGGYLVHSGGCADCHTPLKPGPKGPEPDLSRGLSGHPQGMVLQAPAATEGSPWIWGGAATNTAFWGPWGVSYAANLTPDATGLGTWNTDQFVRAMRTGRHAGSGRPVAPPMPWQAVGQLSDADLQAMFAYLHAQPPVRNEVPAYQPPAPRH